MADNEVKAPTHQAAEGGQQVESEGSVFLSPPAFQLKASGGEGVVQKKDPEETVVVTTTVDIQASVGKGGVNHVSDVAQVQARLVELGLLVSRETIDLAGREPNAVVGADEMKSLIKAITYFQRGVQGSTAPDGKIDPNGTGEIRLNANTTTAQQNQQAVAPMVNHDTLDAVSIHIIQNVLRGKVDGDLRQDQNTTATTYTLADETDSQTRINNFQTAPTGYDNQPIAGAAANTDRRGWIEESTVAQVFSILVGANQHGYALYLVIDYYEDFVDAPNAANPLKLSLGNSLEVYYDASLTTDFAAYDEMGGLRSVAVGPRAFTSATTLRSCLSNSQTATATQRPSGMTAAATQVVDQSLVTADAQTTVNAGISATALTTAISYNSGKFAQIHSVKIIQALVGAPITGAFDQDTIRRIAYFQSAHNIGQATQENPDTLTANGQLDPKTVDLMGRDLLARQEFNSAIQFAMDYYNINVSLSRAVPLSDPTTRTGTMFEGEGSNLTSVVYDPNLAEAMSTDASLNNTNADPRIRDVRGIGAIRIGQAAFTSFTALVTAISRGISDIARPGAGQTATEGTNRSLIPPLADMSTFQVPYPTNWEDNGGSGWKGATKGGQPGGKHGGWDLYAPIGTPIRAVADGVADTGNQGDYGRVVRLLANGRVYFYAHLNAFAIPATGQTTVTQGQVLGYVGVAGNAKVQRPHLHFEVRTGTVITTADRQDPGDYFTRPTKQRFYSTKHKDMIVAEILNDTANPYPEVPQVQPAGENGAPQNNAPENGGR